MNLPIGLTITRIVAVPLLILFLISSSRVHALIAAAIFVARLHHRLAGRGAGAAPQPGHDARARCSIPIADKLLVAAALVSLLTIDKIDAWIVVVIIGRELAVTGLRAVAAGVGVIVPASRLAKWKTVSQYVAVTMLILEKGLVSPAFHVAATGVLWVALGADDRLGRRLLLSVLPQGGLPRDRARTKNAGRERSSRSSPPT